MQAERVTSFALAATMALLAGCAATPAPPTPPVPDDSYCQTVMKPRRKVCILGGVPPVAQAKEAATLDGAAGAFTVYIARNNWADPTELVELRSPGGPAVKTLPRTFARFRLPPGQHELGLGWGTGATQAVVVGVAGEVQYLQLKGWAFWSKRDFSLNKIDRATALQLTRDSKFVGDVASQ